ncbi:Protein of unknown function [Bacillus mycoides]|nr:Protein of unknown function [Bacillus mycoides]
MTDKKTVFFISWPLYVRSLFG